MSSKYQMWLTFNSGNQKIQFPVLPESIELQYGSKNTVVDINGLGEISIKQERPLVNLSFSCHFPSEFYSGVQVNKLTNPESLVDTIRNWQNSNKPSYFLVTGMDVGMYCTIENFVCTENGGDIGSIYYSLSLQEYREVSVRQVKVDVKTRKATVPVTPARTDNRSQTAYTVVSGDCLYNIAKAKLGNASRWPEIYNLNKDVIESTARSRGFSSSNNGWWIFPGTVLSLPS